MRITMIGLMMIAAGALFGCPGIGEQRNPFLTATEEYGSTTGGSDSEGSGGRGRQVTAAFRQKLTLTMANFHPDAELNVSLAAWVNPSSIRNTDQQDELLENNYYRLDEEIKLGDAFMLVPGTYVYAGPGVAGSTSVRLNRATTVTEQDAANPEGESTTLIQATERSFELVTPDVVLVYSQPPISCDSVAFYFTVDGDPLTSEGLTGVGDIYAGPNSPFGGLKTLAQVDVYQCDPLKPGLFFWQGGSARGENEYLEGQNLRFEFYRTPTATGDFCVVTKG